MKVRTSSSARAFAIVRLRVVFCALFGHTWPDPDGSFFVALARRLRSRCRVCREPYLNFFGR